MRLWETSSTSTFFCLVSTAGRVCVEAVGVDETTADAVGGRNLQSLVLCEVGARHHELVQRGATLGITGLGVVDKGLELLFVGATDLARARHCAMV